MPSAFHTGGRAFSGTDPRLVYNSKGSPPGFAVDLPAEGRRVRLTYGTPMMFDLASFEVVYVRFSGGFDLVGRPYGQPVIDRPSQEHQPGLRYLALVEKFGPGPVSWTVTSMIVMNRMKREFEKFEYATEAARGLLPVYEYSGDDPITLAKWPGEVFHAPIFRILDWTDRPAEVFGPPTVEPPVPVLEATIPPVALPSSRPVEQPANDSAPAYRPVAANDLLAKYIKRDPTA